ncbi:MAG TPA: hypothetical protein VGD99_04440 [Anaerolineae bacterium]
MVKPRGEVFEMPSGPADEPTIFPDEFAVLIWYQDKAHRRPIQVHLVVKFIGMESVSLVYRFKGPDTLGFLIEEMARQRAIIWPKAGAMPAVRWPARSGDPADPYAKKPVGYYGLGTDSIFGTLASVSVSAWCPNDRGEDPTELHLRFQATDGKWVALVFKNPDAARVFLKELIACRRHVWPKAERVTLA